MTIKKLHAHIASGRILIWLIPLIVLPATCTFSGMHLERDKRVCEAFGIERGTEAMTECVVDLRAP